MSRIYFSLALAQILLLSSPVICSSEGSYEEAEAVRAAIPKRARVASVEPIDQDAFLVLSDQDLFNFFKPNQLDPQILQDFSNSPQGLNRLLSFMGSYQKNQSRVFVIMDESKVVIIDSLFKNKEATTNPFNNDDTKRDLWYPYARCLNLCVAFHDPKAMTLALQLPWYFMKHVSDDKVLKDYAPAVLRFIQDANQRKAIEKAYVDSLVNEAKSKTGGLGANHADTCFPEIEGLIQKTQGAIVTYGLKNGMNLKKIAKLFSGLASKVPDNRPELAGIQYRLFKQAAEYQEEAISKILKPAPSTYTDAAEAHEQASKFAVPENKNAHVLAATRLYEKARELSAYGKNANKNVNAQSHSNAMRAHEQLPDTDEVLIKRADQWNAKIIIHNGNVTLGDYETAIGCNLEASKKSANSYAYLKQAAAHCDKIISIKRNYAINDDFAKAAIMHKKASDAATQESDKKFHNQKSIELYSKIKH